MSRNVLAVRKQRIIPINVGNTIETNVHFLPISCQSIAIEDRHGTYKRQKTKNETTLALLAKQTTLVDSKIDLEIPYSGKATFRILSDGILVREREIQ